MRQQVTREGRRKKKSIKSNLGERQDVGEDIESDSVK